MPLPDLKAERIMRRASGIGLAILASMIIISCSRPQAVRLISYRNLRVASSGFSHSAVSMDLVFFNPNPYTLKMKDANLDVFLNEVQLGHFEYDSLISMPAKDTFYYPVRLNVDMATLLNNFLSSNIRDSITIRATGNCKVGRSGVFINLPIRYEDKAYLKLY